MMMNIRGIVMDDPAHVVDLQPINFGPSASVDSRTIQLQNLSSESPTIAKSSYDAWSKDQM
jgi:hypothetical protein